MIDLAKSLLNCAIELTTQNPNAQARDGQEQLLADIVSTMELKGHLSGVAPTGSGKSFATLSAAFAVALERDERTVISTNSLALMSQLENKDIPILQECVAKLVPGVQVRVGFIKGISNYVDPLQVIAAAQKLTSSQSTFYAELAELLDSQQAYDKEDSTETGQFRDLVRWGLGLYIQDDTSSNDRHNCPIKHNDIQWGAISASAGKASDGKMFRVTPKIERAKQLAEQADIIITNHSILATQAAKKLPIIIGSEALGTVDHIIIDEAHALAAQVRNVGTASFSAQKIRNVMKKMQQLVRVESAPWRAQGENLAKQIDSSLREYLVRAPTRKLDPDEASPLQHYRSSLRIWVDQGVHLLNHTKSHVRFRVLDIIELLGALQDAFEDALHPEPGWARWVQKGTTDLPPTINIAPVDVRWLIKNSLWEYTDYTDQKKRLGVIAISATLPKYFAVEVGMSAEVVQKKYPSPFERAYSKSALFIPKLEAKDVEKLTERYKGRYVFDTSRHATWAQEIIVDLVRANRGRALVLAAKANDAKDYAKLLKKALPELAVYTQWDAEGVSGVITRWKQDIHSVLVGVRSLMTGVDAAGETCALVIVDRVPRSPSNPLDEARVDELEKRVENRYIATNTIYVSDASTLLAQAAGRLIRSQDDFGMVAVLDPRMLKTLPGSKIEISYNQTVRETYMGAVAHFGEKIAQKHQAIRWLTTH